MILTTRKNYTDWTPKGMVYLLFFLGLITMVYGIITSNWLIFSGIVFLPIATIFLFLFTKNPMFSYLLFGTIVCYFSAIYRYARVEGLSVIVDISLCISILSILINVINQRDSYLWKMHLIFL